MLKKVSLFAVVLLLAVSTVFALDVKQITGSWRYKDEDTVYTKIFTSDGHYVFEEEGEYGDYYEFGEFEIDGNILETDYCDFEISMDKKNLIIDGETYKRVLYKATSSNSKIAGVWTNDYYTLGLAKDGLAISMGAYSNIGDYKVEDGEIEIDGYESDYIIVNDYLYIEDFDFLNEYYTIKLKRQSSSYGTNQTSKANLCKQSWFFQNTNATDQTGTNYTFKTTGSFVGENYSNGQKTGDSKGTYTMDGSRIHLSTGEFIGFAIIDGTAIGYSVR